MFIYIAVNKIDHKAYVGMTKNLARQQFRRTRLNLNMPINQAIRKYGVRNFDWAVLETAESRQEASQKEREWITRLGTQRPCGYNVTEGGERGYTLPADVRERLSKMKRGRKVTPEEYAKLAPTMFKKGFVPWSQGVKFSEEHRRNLSIAHMGHKASKATKAKMSAAQLGHANRNHRAMLHGSDGKFLKLPVE